jgi:carbamoyl-phosphate synthase small subunit
MGSIPIGANEPVVTPVFSYPGVISPSIIETNILLENCYLVLADGSVYPGKSFGELPPRTDELKSDDVNLDPAGEVVFNTGMTGYHEILTDPSYKGQIVVMTYPHIGNYGSSDDWSEKGPEENVASEEIKARGLVVRALYTGPAPSKRATLHEFLTEHRISGISDVDTRKLTLRIRDEGSPNGVIVRAADGSFIDEDKKRALDFLADFPSMEGRDLVSEIGTRAPVVINKKGNPHICVVDSGVKSGIIRELAALGCKVTLVSNNATVESISATKAEGVLFANGPGDPAVLDHLIKTAKALIGRKAVFGICLGHQILSLALGAKTYKMKFGHHGVNNPVRDERTKMILVTSQNHGFAVDESSLPKDVEVRFRNANDGTIEGIQHQKLPLFCVQFHPEAAPGPRDSLWIFKEFIKYVE